MNNDVILREMLPDEADLLIKIGKQNFTPVEQMAMSKPENALVATVDGKLAGALFYKVFERHKTNPIVYVDLAYVVKEFRGMGIGDLLYRSGVQMLKDKGYDTITAMVVDDNAASWKLFEKQGFSRPSFTSMTQILGFKRSLMLWLKTIYCISCGMNMWISIPAKKHNSGVEIATFLLTNVLLILPFAFVYGLTLQSSPLSILLAYGAVLLINMVSGYIGCVITKERWVFSFTRGGLLISIPLQLLGICYPVLGRWYPANFNKTLHGKRILGIEALCEWLGLLILFTVSVFNKPHSSFWHWANFYSMLMLVYHVIAIFPFAHFGGKRILDWNKAAFVVLAALSLAKIALNFILQQSNIDCIALKGYNISMIKNLVEKVLSLYILR